MFIFINLDCRNIYIILRFLGSAAKPFYSGFYKPKLDFLRRQMVGKGHIKVLEDEFLMVYKISQNEIMKI